MLLRPLPYSAPAELVSIWSDNTRLAEPANPVSPANYEAFRASSSFAGVEAMYSFMTSVRLRVDDEAEVAQAATISIAAAAAMRAASERKDPDKMAWFFLEALVALLIAVGIVAWTMGPKRRKPPRVTAGDADRDKKAR